MAAAALLQFGLSSSSWAAPSYRDLPGFGTPEVTQEAASRLQEIANSEEERYDENLMTPELKSFVERAAEGKIKPEQLNDERLKVNFKRTYDGRVALRNRQGKWYNVKADMQTQGFMLLQDDLGYVFYLPPDEEDNLMQIDLSDDLVVAQLFSNTAWQDVMQPLQMTNPQGKAVNLQMTEQQFRNTLSLLYDAEEPEPEAALQPSP